MTTFTLLIKTEDISKVYSIVYNFICFVNIDNSSFQGIKEVTFKVREEDAAALEDALAEAEII